MDGIYLKRNWGGEVENVAVLVAIAVNEDGYREVIGVYEGMLEAVHEVFPDVKYQRCIVHFYRNVFSAVPRSKAKLVAKMLKAIHAQESKEASREKAKAVAQSFREMKLPEAAKKLENGIEETLTYTHFPFEHWTRIRTNNAIERLNQEIRRPTRVVGAFPDGNSALMLVYARLRHVAGTQWGSKKYMNIEHLQLRAPNKTEKRQERKRETEGQDEYELIVHSEPIVCGNDEARQKFFQPPSDVFPDAKNFQCPVWQCDA